VFDGWQVKSFLYVRMSYWARSIFDMIVVSRAACGESFCPHVSFTRRLLASHLHEQSVNRKLNRSLTWLWLSTSFLCVELELEPMNNDENESSKYEQIKNEQSKFEVHKNSFDVLWRQIIVGDVMSSSRWHDRCVLLFWFCLIFRDEFLTFSSTSG
jgi:hypothetical protein